MNAPAPALRSSRLAAVAALAALGLVAQTTWTARAHAAVAAASATPEEIARARRAFKKGETLYAIGRFEDALKEYERAYQIVELPELLFNMGQCQRNLERFEEAIFSFKQFLKRKPDAPNRAAVEDLLKELDAKLAGSRKRADGDRLTPPAADPFDDGSAPPIYKRWWFIAGAVGVGVLATSVALSSGGGGSVPASDLGNVDLR